MTTRQSHITKAPLATLEKGLTILEYISKANRLIRLKDVANHFSMDRSTALRFLKTLEFTGYIEKYEELKAYSPGPKLTSLTAASPSQEELVPKIKPYLAELARLTNNIAHLGVLDGEKASLAGVAPSPARVTVKQAVGDFEPLYCSAVGKAIFAFLPEEERQSIKKFINFTKHTKHTILDFETLELEAAKIREQGVAFDNREGSLDVICIAVPIFDQDKNVIFSIGVSMVAGVVNGHPSQQHTLIEQVQLIAEKINREIIYKPR